MSYSSTALIVSLFFVAANFLLQKKKKPWAIWTGNPHPSARTQREWDHVQRCSEAESLRRDTNIQFKN